MADNGATRPLTEDERALAHWMLEHGGSEARDYLSQLDLATASTWRCKCGCASFNFKIAGRPDPAPGVHVLGDYIFGGENDMSGIFIFSSAGTLSGIEVYGLSGAAPAILPRPSDLRRSDSVESR
jgi:hypothetical protein